MATTQTPIYEAGEFVPYHDDFEGDPAETCFCCNRALGKSGWGILVVDGGVIGDPATDDDPSAPGYMGVYRVGATCRKKFPTAFKFINRH